MPTKVTTRSTAPAVSLRTLSMVIAIVSYLLLEVEKFIIILNFIRRLSKLGQIFYITSEVVSIKLSALS
jgi:hypothetical protein